MPLMRCISAASQWPKGLQASACGQLWPSGIWFWVAAPAPAPSWRPQGNSASGEPALGLGGLLQGGPLPLAGTGGPAEKATGFQHQHVPHAHARPAGELGGGGRTCHLEFGRLAVLRLAFRALFYRDIRHSQYEPCVSGCCSECPSIPLCRHCPICCRA